MMDIERISKKIREEKDNLIAKAFTCQISSLLLTNGIVPIMTEYRKNDLESITDTDRYKLVYELGVTFDTLDTTEHDKQIRAEVIEEYKYNTELFREIFLEELERQAVNSEEIIMYQNICSMAWNKYLEQLKEQK